MSCPLKTGELKHMCLTQKKQKHLLRLQTTILIEFYMFQV